MTRKTERVVTGLLDSPRRWWIPAGFSIAALLMCAASAVVGVDDVVRPSDGKQVGYLAAPNWTLAFVVIFPIVLAGVLAFLAEVDRVCRSLVDAGMVYDEERARVLRDPVPLRQAWRRRLASVLVAWPLLSLMGLGGSVGIEWRAVSLAPLEEFETLADLEAHNAANAGERVEVDWAVAALVEPNDVDEVPNLVFSLLAFAFQGLGVAVVLLLLLVAVAFGGFVYQHVWGASPLRLHPMTRSEDKRRGFQRFQDAGTVLLVTGLAQYAGFYLTVLQNAYLRSGDATGIWEFALKPAEEAVRSRSNLLEAFNVHIGSDWSSVWVLLAAFLVLFVVVAVVPCLVLAFAARRAHDNLSMLAESTEAGVFARRFGIAPGELPKGIRAWPYEYVRENVLLASLLLAAASMLWISFAPFLFGALLVLVLMQLKASVQRRFDVEAPAEGPSPKSP